MSNEALLMNALEQNAFRGCEVVVISHRVGTDSNPRSAAANITRKLENSPREEERLQLRKPWRPPLSPTAKASTRHIYPPQLSPRQKPPHHLSTKTAQYHNPPPYRTAQTSPAASPPHYSLSPPSPPCSPLYSHRLASSPRDLCPRAA